VYMKKKLLNCQWYKKVLIYEKNNLFTNYIKVN